jgi:uncharacterized protein YxeA
MKKIIIVVLLIVSVTIQKGLAQNHKDSLASKDPLNSILSAYLDLKNALAKDDGSNASSSAKELFKAIDKVSLDKLSTEQHRLWMKYSEKLSYDAEHIKETMDIEHQREHFVSLSKNMYQVIKEFNTNGYTVYYQFCPMANDGKGAYWLSEAEKISNPYMGKKMPGCGSTKETIKVK